METFTCGGQTHEVAIYSHAKTGLEFVLVPAADASLRPLLACRTEMTQGAWDRLDLDERVTLPPDGPKRASFGDTGGQGLQLEVELGG